MMPSMQKANCSWSLLAAVGTLLVMLSVVHLFLFPLGPTLDYFSVRQAQTSCVPTNKSTKGIGSIQHNVELDLDHRFPADLHNAVIYRGAPWKAEIGRWLSGCDAIVEEIHITEVRFLPNELLLDGILFIRCTLVLSVAIGFQILFHENSVDHVVAVLDEFIQEISVSLWQCVILF